VKKKNGDIITIEKSFTEVIGPEVFNVEVEIENGEAGFIRTIQQNI